MKSIIIVFLVASSLSVFAGEYVHSDVPRVETIYSLSIAADLVQIQVESNGCTTKESFLVQKYLDPNDNIIRLLFIRNRPDFCRAFPSEGALIEFSKDDLNIARDVGVRVENPFSHNPRKSN
ncbi:MAG: hypothetical protein AABY53_03080 [Bdellovibrionota bacterium]